MTESKRIHYLLHADFHAEYALVKYCDRRCDFRAQIAWILRYGVREARTWCASGWPRASRMASASIRTLVAALMSPVAW